MNVLVFKAFISPHLMAFDYRTIRQLVLIGIPIGIAGFIAFFIFTRVVPPATCFDNKLNQGEERVDCGGPCVACALLHPKPLEVFFVKFAEVFPGVYDIAIEIKNPNVVLAAKRFSYQLVVHDSAGVIVQKKSGSSYIYPLETVHAIEAGFAATRKIGKIDFVVDEADIELVQSEKGQPDLIGGDKEVSFIERGNGNVATKLTFKIFNRTIFDYKNVDVGVLVFDEKQNVIAMNTTVVGEIKGGESVSVAFTWPGKLSINPSRIQIEPRVNLISANRE